jgi:hypothetical protein
MKLELPSKEIGFKFYAAVGHFLVDPTPHKQLHNISCVMLLSTEGSDVSSRLPYLGRNLFDAVLRFIQTQKCPKALRLLQWVEIPVVGAHPYDGGPGTGRGR